MRWARLAPVQAALFVVLYGLPGLLPVPAAGPQVKENAPAAPPDSKAADAPFVGPPAPFVSAEEQLLTSVGLSHDGPALLEFFRRRVQADVDPGRVPELVRRLGDAAPESRDRAAAELVSLGTSVIPWLRQAANDLENLERAERARKTLQAIEGSAGGAVVGAAARLLAVHKPAGAAEALLAYLPFVEDDQAADDIQAALAAVARRDGQADPALHRALEDPVPLRRAIAAEVLCQVGGPADRAAARKLLQDPRASVRLRTALALAQHHDVESVAALIDLLGELPADQAKPIEEYLRSLAGEWALSPPPGNDRIARAIRRDAWAAWWQRTDGPSLLEEFRKQTPTEEVRRRSLALFDQLNDGSSAVRDKALADLLDLGVGGVAVLRRLSQDADPAVKERAEKALRLLPRDAAPPVPSAAARLVALRKPPQATATLLAYLPYTDDEYLIGEVQAALSVVGFAAGQPDPKLLRALEDSEPARRTAAALVLCQLGSPEHRQKVRKLLHDPDRSVRWRAGLALAEAKDRDAVPVLIDLLAELPYDQASQVENLLYRLAGEHAPTVSLGSDAASRRKCRDAWAAWWRDSGPAIDLARLDEQRPLGFTLIVEFMDPLRRTGRVLELDRTGKVRWQVDGLQYPMDAQVLPGDKVLIAEQNAGRVTERDFRGNILWQQPVNQPIGVQRLANGNTFITSRVQILEVDRTGKEVFSQPHPNGDLLGAARLRNGDLVFLTQAGLYTRIDSAGKEQKSYRVGSLQYYYSGIDFLPNDRLLVPMYQGNKVVEYDSEGKTAWEVSVPLPTSAARLPNGNTLVVSASPLPRVLELDRAGKTVHEFKENIRPSRARWR